MTWSLKLKLGNEVAESHGKGEDKISARVLDHPCRRNETTKLELPRAWEPLDSS